MNVAAIKDAISALPQDERHSLAAWLNELDYDAWGQQMVVDFAPGGRGMDLVARVKQEVAEGKSRRLDEGRLLARSQREKPRQ